MVSADNNVARRGLVFFAYVSRYTYLNKLALPVFICSVVGIYLLYGSLYMIPSYYAAPQRELRSNQHLLRPMYAKLQRELVKSKLDLPFSLDNLDLIIHFATIHSQLGAGILPEDVKTLINAVLRVAPGQVTALNLLAIDAYKVGRYEIAVMYWQRIVELVDPTRPETAAVAILRQKIAETKKKIIQFESIHTKS